VDQQSAPSAAAPPVRVRRAAARAGRARPAALRRIASGPTALPLTLILATATLLRLWQLNHVGFNSDEAVYSGQGAAIANDPQLAPFFPIFRAHPLLFQTGLSLGFRIHLGDGFERVAAAAFGVATVYLVYELGRLLYGRGAALIAALVMALMPYHVLISRQVLLDGPMTFFATLTLVLLARFASGGRRAWLNAAAAAMGLTLLTKETSILLVGAAYAFLALTPQLRVRLRDLAVSLAVTALVILPLPITMAVAGRAHTGGSYLTWQLLRRPNHDWLFYPATVPEVIGPLVLVAALAGLWLLRREGSWRETLLLCWIAVPVAFFQLWPVKGFPYLLPIAPPLAVLAGRALAAWWRGEGGAGQGRRAERGFALLATAILAGSLLMPAWQRVQKPGRDGYLAGAGGVPGGRELGEWIDRSVPRGAAFMTVGPSMANLVQYYGHRKAYGLSVSPNPLNRNPSYEPLTNPNEAIRGDDLQYLVWDAFSADRSSTFSGKLRAYARRYHGRVVHTELLPARTRAGKRTGTPAIVVYEVRP
jgi:Dolichyl-phosphate-mannose-protein mannosyltransferase